MVEVAENVLSQRIWNGKNSRYPLKIHIAGHREAYNDLERASHQITYKSPNETSRVRYLLNSIQYGDATICAAKTTIQVDISKKYNFELAADFILITVPPPRNSNPIHQISAVNKGNNNGNRRGKFGGKVKTGPKTGVELRFHKKNEWMKLSQP